MMTTRNYNTEGWHIPEMDNHSFFIKEWNYCFYYLHMQALYITMMTMRDHKIEGWHIPKTYDHSSLKNVITQGQENTYLDSENVPHASNSHHAHT